eukprot:5502472-Prymnesium_polylepis.1
MSRTLPKQRPTTHPHTLRTGINVTDHATTASCPSVMTQATYSHMDCGRRRWRRHACAARAFAPSHCRRHSRTRCSRRRPR